VRIQRTRQGPGEKLLLHEVGKGMMGFALETSGLSAIVRHEHTNSVLSKDGLML
jgi:hypothetical protein